MGQEREREVWDDDFGYLPGVRPVHKAVGVAYDPRYVSAPDLCDLPDLDVRIFCGLFVLALSIESHPQINSSGNTSPLEGWIGVGEIDEFEGRSCRLLGGLLDGQSQVQGVIRKHRAAVRDERGVLELVGHLRGGERHEARGGNLDDIALHPPSLFPLDESPAEALRGGAAETTFADYDYFVVEGHGSSRYLGIMIWISNFVFGY